MAELLQLVVDMGTVNRVNNVSYYYVLCVAYLLFACFCVFVMC